MVDTVTRVAGAPADRTVLGFWWPQTTQLWFCTSAGWAGYVPFYMPGDELTPGSPSQSHYR